MQLTAPDFNAFAEKLATRFVSRAKGQDEASARLVGIRPSDHVLCGFLTPAGQSDVTRAPEDADESVATDLPQDGSYEQSAIGAEWLAPRTGLSSAAQIVVEMSFCIFVRRLPTYDEQKQYALWRSTSSDLARNPKTGEEPAGRMCDLVPVWTRQQLPSLKINISFRDLLAARSVSRSMSSAVSAAVADIDKSDLYYVRAVCRQPLTQLLRWPTTLFGHLLGGQNQQTTKTLS